ncbi:MULTISPECIES: hypothetical protein [unclassified Variovorax]|uniref:hypothetical protein n=1 Tax=unclassified Variovorax TaxID=663243 RepID=UPI0034E95F5E
MLLATSSRSQLDSKFENAAGYMKGKYSPSTKLDLALGFIDGILGLGLLSGAALAAIIGQVVLGAVLIVLAVGIFLRFKRRRVRKS